MLVEDDRPTRSALERIYSRQGWVVDVATTVAEAVSRLKDYPDFVILDLMLPDGDGTVVLQAIRAAQIPARVAVTTGTSDEDRIRAVRALNPDLLLFKPIRLRDLDKAMGGPA